MNGRIGGRIASRRSLQVIPLALIATLSLGACAMPAASMSSGGRSDAAVAGSVRVAESKRGPVSRVDLKGSITSGPILLGRPGVLTIVARNRSRAAVTLRTVTVAVGRPSRPGCLPAWLRFGTYPARGQSPVRIPARGTTNVRIPFVLVNLPLVNQDACKNASFPLTFSGIGQPS